MMSIQRGQAGGVDMEVSGKPGMPFLNEDENYHLCNM